ncbi:hypothetical protein V475_02340 [Sphingobium baderi LL03]|uniref:Uncharacterized protein n=1 Tax=Sphingobium baderi LL03 TaxID=1114964 RepID=T0GD71_9SPHN|nr:hypothetical protein L485_19790 [Sphingobium baderi LL03]KMS63503.1 hypothetical protein V475_02340 [Sphingobium baderi LL03]
MGKPASVPQGSSWNRRAPFGRAARFHVSPQADLPAIKALAADMSGLPHGRTLYSRLYGLG